MAEPNSITSSWHYDRFEIFYFLRGRSRWWVDGRSVDLAGNDLLFLPPNTIHNFRDGVRDACEYYWLQLNATPYHHCAETMTPSAKGVANKFGSIKDYQFAGSKKLVSLFQAMFQEHLHPDSFSGVCVTALVMQFTAEVIRCHKETFAVKQSVDGRQTQVQAAIAACQAAPETSTVAFMARAARMPLRHFRPLFIRHMGMAPHDFLVRMKIERAKVLLAEGKSITETAHELAFSSSQYFARVFRKLEGQTCSEFRQTIT
jgi:AraC-like DNA-binding protein